MRRSLIHLWILALAGALPACAAASALPSPRLAQDLRLSAEVLVEALIDSTGAVRATNIVHSHPVLDDSASMAVRARSFEPARDSTGRAIASVRTLPVSFASRRVPDIAFDHYVAGRAELMRFEVIPDLRPDSTGRLVARWSARGTKSHELRLVVLTPDGVLVEPTPDMTPQRLLDDVKAPGWPAWRRSGKQLKAGTSGEIALQLPGTAWWTTGRIAFVALYCDILDRTWVVRQSIFRIEADAMGPLLVRDTGPDDILAGPDRVLGPRSGEAYRAFPVTPSTEPQHSGPAER